MIYCLLTVILVGVALLLAFSLSHSSARAAEEDTDSGINVDLFDYDQNTVNDATNNIFKFNWGGSGDKYGWNDYKNNGKQGNGTFPEIVSDVLPKSSDWRSENPMFGSAIQNKLGPNGISSVGNSMDYLFTQNPKVAKHYSIKSVGDGGLLAKSNDGTYSFNSQNEIASVNIGDANDTKTIKKDTSKVNGNARFLPFNEQRDGQYAKDTENNYHFGMKVTAQFMQPKGGLLPNGNPMVFNFTGDDDVWVYIDGHLVLDIGGIHDAISGSINFATGAVTVDGANRFESTLQKLLGHDLTDYSNHQLSFFYMERGAGGSNAKIDFNLQTVPSGSIQVGKEISGTSDDQFVDSDFKMQVDTADSTDGRQPSEGSFKPYSGAYSLYEGSVADDNLIPCGKESGSDLYTCETTDGTFSIKPGQKALLHDDTIKATTWYRVHELVASNYDQEDYVLDSTKMVNNEGATVIDESAQSGEQIGQTIPLMVGQDPQITMQNAFQKLEKYSVAIQKKLVGLNSGGEKYTMHVTNGAGIDYAGEYYVVDSEGLSNFTCPADVTQIPVPGGQTAQSVVDGKVLLGADEAAVLCDMAPGTTMNVEELNLDMSKYQDPLYSVNDGESSTNPVEGLVVGDSSRPLMTVTNSLKTQPVTVQGFKVYKKVVGNPTDDDFHFTMKLVAGNAEGITEGLDSDDSARSGITQSFVDGQTRDTTFSQLTFKTPGTYEFQVTEDEAQNNAAPTGWSYDKGSSYITVKVSMGENGEGDLESSVAYKYCPVASNGPSSEHGGEGCITTDSQGETYTGAEFTNKFIAVSNLPFTGVTFNRQNLLGAGLGISAAVGLALAAYMQIRMLKKRSSIEAW